MTISVNPFCSIAGLHDIKTFHSQHASKDEDAHIFSIAADAMENVVDQSQSIIVNGVCGSGKSAVCEQITRFLLKHKHSAVSDVSSSIYSLEDEILACVFILECFGSAHTLLSDNSSRFVKYVKFQVETNVNANAKINEKYSFGRKGLNAGSVVIGANIACCMLEKSRVVRQPVDEQSFNVFYHMLFGLNVHALGVMGLSLSQSFRFLSGGLSQDAAHQSSLKNSGVKSVGFSQQYADDFVKLQIAFEKIGFAKELQSEVFKIIAVVLHLGNLMLVPLVLVGDVGNTTCSAATSSQFSFVAEVLGLDNLDSLLTTKYINKDGRSSVCSVELTVDQSADAACALAKDLYDKLFAWLGWWVDAMQSLATSMLKTVTMART